MRMNSDMSCVPVSGLNFVLSLAFIIFSKIHLHDNRSSKKRATKFVLDCSVVITGWPTKMFLFFFRNNFCKNKEALKIFSPQILEVYRILLV